MRVTATAFIVALAAASKLTLQAETIHKEPSTLSTDAEGNLHINSTNRTVYINGVDVLAGLADCSAMRAEIDSMKALVFSPPADPPLPPPPLPPPPLPPSPPPAWPDAATLRAQGTIGSHTPFGCTGAEQSVVVPNGAFMYYVEVWGAAGGGSNAETYQFPGGCGGTSTGYISVVPGATLTLEVGCGGEEMWGAAARPFPHGGLPSYRPNYGAGSGGGRSSVRTGSTYLLVAGGGGGSAGKGCGNTACSTAGGAGGGLNGTSGLNSCPTSPTDCGGAGPAGGMFGSADGSNGVALQGGDACQGINGCNSVGGGGDGWFGGSVAGAHSGGGGGSGYVAESVIDGATSEATVMCGVAGGSGSHGLVHLSVVT